MFDWQDMHYFGVLARTGSLSAASRELGVDHATVGRRVTALERDLGLRLIDRLPRRTALTTDGRMMAAAVVAMETAAYTLERSARGAMAKPTATVRVSASPAVAAHLIAPQMAEFRRAHPDITLVLSGVPRFEALDRGEADLAIRLAKPEEPELIAQRIGILHLGLYATPLHAALPTKEWTFIAYDTPLDHVSQQTWLRQFLNGRPLVFQASDLFSQQAAARTGLGAVVLPCFMGDADPTLVRVPADPPPPSRTVWLAVYPEVYRAPAVRAVVGFLRNIIGRVCPPSGKQMR
ncbi:MAG: LysR family transcriptional regulator [Acidiferrobacteraceae bacterium]